MGDPIRESAFPGYLDSFAPQFFNFNRGKRSIILDLKAEGGVDTLKLLLADADVLITNIRSGTIAFACPAVRGSGSGPGSG